MGARGRGDSLEEALLARARSAIEAAARITADSEVLLEISRSLRDGTLTTRCAWCSRFRVAGRWVVVKDMPRTAALTAATHGICEDCLQAPRKAGMRV